MGSELAKFAADLETVTRMLLVEKQNWYSDQQQADSGDNPPGACWPAWSGVSSGMQKRPPAPGPIEPCHE